MPPARKRFGQHFLEPAWVDKLIEAIDPGPVDTVLEIGPGRGALTVPLAGRVRMLIAVEIDRDLAAALPALVPGGRLRVVPADFLDVDLEALLQGVAPPVRVAGNLPYNVSSPILFKLLAGADAGRRFSDATLMLQKEVADRLLAPPGTPEYGVLAVQVALLADVKRLLTLPPGAFRPPPKVTSAVVRLTLRPPAEEVGDADVFVRLVRGVFQQRRKMLSNALAPIADTFGRTAGDLLERSGVEGTRRAETLTLAEFARLSRAML